MEEEDLDKLPVTVTITMTYAGWRKLKEDLGKTKPADRLWCVLTQTLSEIERSLTLWTKSEETLS